MQRALITSEYRPAVGSDSAPFELLNLDTVLAFLRRRWLLMGIGVGVGAAAGVLYLLTAVPQYTAATSILIDANNQQVVDQMSAIGGILSDDASMLSQVEIIRSRDMATAVVDKLDLTNDPEFNTIQQPAISAILSALFGLADAAPGGAQPEPQISEEAKHRQAVAMLASGLEVSRLGRTYVLRVLYTSPSPGLAARLSQAYASAYLADQLSSKYEATRSASEWLDARIAELRARSIESDLTVQKFRADNGLIATGGELLTDQQLSQLTAQLIAVQGSTAEAEARYRGVQAMIDSGDVNAVSTESINNPLISEMRSRYLDASKREAEIASKQGAQHSAAVRAQAEMDEYGRLMFEELTRIAASYKTDLDIAKAREKNLSEQVKQATGVSTLANDALVQLRELEREAGTYRNLYETFLQRYQEAIQQQSFPVTEARVISKAEVPLIPSSPKTLRSLLIAGALGGALALALALFLEVRDRVFRTADHVRQSTGTEFLGILPTVAGKAVGRSKASASAATRSLRHRQAVTRFAIDQPMSVFAETMRSAHIGIDLAVPDKRRRIIGVVSAFQGEGKSVVAVNLAESLARQGKRTLLIDADMKNPTLSKLLAPEAEKGLQELLVGNLPLSEVVHTDVETGLAFVPSMPRRSIAYSSDLLSSPAMDLLLQGLSEVEYVILDLPPIGPVVDARAVTAKVDGFLLVVEWGKTSRNAVRSMLQAQWPITDKIIGTMLNKVEMRRFRLYASDPVDYEYSIGGRSKRRA